MNNQRHLIAIWAYISRVRLYFNARIRFCYFALLKILSFIRALIWKHNFIIVHP